MLQLFKIEDVFDIGRGCILVPGIPHSLGIKVEAGAPLKIVTPSGEQISTHIASFEHFHRRNEGLSHAAFAVAEGLRKAQLPIGSHVYLDQESG